MSLSIRAAITKYYKLNCRQAVLGVFLSIQGAITKYYKLGVLTFISQSSRD